MTPRTSPPSAKSPPSPSADGDSGTRSRATTSHLVGDAGPPFDPKGDGAAAPPPTAEPPLAAVLPEWEETTVRSILEAKGSALHAIAAVEKESDEWLYTQIDLQVIAPPLTRILNRYDATRAAAGTGDEIAVVIGLSGYVSRSWQTRMRSRATVAEEEPEPASGVPASPGSGPPPDSPLMEPDEEPRPEEERPGGWQTP